MLIDLFPFLPGDESLGRHGRPCREDAGARCADRPRKGTTRIRAEPAGTIRSSRKILTELIHRRGPSSETYGLLGRVYKDRWEKASKAGQGSMVKVYLSKAVDAYLKGFETDWRDAYPGVNAVTLMALCEPPDERRHELLPVVRYAVQRKIAAGTPDYWDYATLLELAVLSSDEAEAEKWLGEAMVAVREKWEPETTVRNLRLIRESREKQASVPPWMLEMETALLTRAG